MGFRRLGIIFLLLPLLIYGARSPARADIISNGTLTVGLDTRTSPYLLTGGDPEDPGAPRRVNFPGGNLVDFVGDDVPDPPLFETFGYGTPTVGMSFGGYDAIKPGLAYEGWGIAGMGTSGFSRSGAPFSHAFPFLIPPSTELKSATLFEEPMGFVADADSAHSVVLVKNMTLDDEVFLVSHDFMFDPVFPNLMLAVVTVEKFGGGMLGDVEYRRVVDWDMTADFRENVDIFPIGDPGPTMFVLNGHDVIVTSSFGGPGVFEHPDPTYPLMGEPGPGFTPLIDSDLGTTFNFFFPAVEDSSLSFALYYGASGIDPMLDGGAHDALAADFEARGLLGYGIARNPDATLAFGLGFGDPPAPIERAIPEPSTVMLLGAGLFAVLISRRRRAA